MNKSEIARQVIVEHGGMARNYDFVESGLSNYDLMILHNHGFIKRIKQGLYQLPDNVDWKEEQFIKVILPKGIVCVESCLYHYGYIETPPAAWSIAVPRTATNQIKNLVEFPIKAYFTRNEIYDIGKTSDCFNGVELFVYDRERTICDCFRFRTKLDNEIFNNAVNAYVFDDKKDLKRLSSYANMLKIYNKVMDVMGVLLNI